MKEFDGIGGSISYTDNKLREIPNKIILCSSLEALRNEAYKLHNINPNNINRVLQFDGITLEIMEKLSHNKTMIDLVLKVVKSLEDTHKRDIEQNARKSIVPVKIKPYNSVVSTSDTW